MLTPKALLLAYEQWKADNGRDPKTMTVCPDLWDLLTKPDPSQKHPPKQPTTFLKAQVILDPTLDDDQVNFA